VKPRLRFTPFETVFTASAMQGRLGLRAPVHCGHTSLYSPAGLMRGRLFSLVRQTHIIFGRLVRSIIEVKRA